MNGAFIDFGNPQLKRMSLAMSSLFGILIRQHLLLEFGHLAACACGMQSLNLF
jgi:hypothetical protein